MAIVARQSEFTGWIWRHGYFGLTRVKESEAIGFGKRRERMSDTGKKNVLALLATPKDSPEDSPQDNPADSVSGSSPGAALVYQSSLTVTGAGKIPLRRGSGGITAHGRRIIDGAAYDLQRATAGKRVSFLTLTLPSISLSESLEIAAGWSEVLRLFGQRLSRSLRRRGLPGEWFGCTEVQPKRLRSSGIPALHLHLCFEGRNPGKAWAVSSAEVRTIWSQCLECKFPWIAGRFWAAVENMQTVRKSCSAYLSKYLTKGVDDVVEHCPEFAAVHPTSWYHCSDSLRRRVLKARVRLSGPLGRVFLDWIESRPPELRFIRRVRIKTSDGGEFTPSVYGGLSPPAVEDWGSLMSTYRDFRNEELLK